MADEVRDRDAGRSAGARSSGRPALFVDRDGTLNDLVYYPDSREWESPRVPADLRIIPGVAQALAAIGRQGWPIFVVSNQPSYAKGKTSLEALHAVHDRLVEELAREGAAIDGAAYCFHHPAGVVPGYSGPCPCRKPSPFSILRLAEEHRIDVARSFMVGDQDMDVLCAQNAGCRSILIPHPASASKRGGAVAFLECTKFGEVLSLLERAGASSQPLRGLRGF